MTTKTKVILGLVAIAVVVSVIIKRQRNKASNFCDVVGTGSSSTKKTKCRKVDPEAITSNNPQGFTNECGVCPSNQTPNC